MDELEKKEIRNLIDEGQKFTIPHKSFLKYFRKESTFEIKQPYLGTLDFLSNEFSKIEFDSVKLNELPIDESKRLMKYSKNLSNIVAIAVLNSYFMIKFFKPLLSFYFRYRITPKTLVNVSMSIHQMMNFEDFINSIRLNAIHRIAQPSNQIEKKAENQSN